MLLFLLIFAGNCFCLSIADPNPKPKPEPQFGQLTQGYVPYNDIFIPQEAYNVFNEYLQKIRSAFSDLPVQESHGLGGFGGQKGGQQNGPFHSPHQAVILRNPIYPQLQHNQNQKPLLTIDSEASNASPSTPEAPLEPSKNQPPLSPTLPLSHPIVHPSFRQEKTQEMDINMAKKQRPIVPEVPTTQSPTSRPITFQKLLTTLRESSTSQSPTLPTTQSPMVFWTTARTSTQKHLAENQSIQGPFLAEDDSIFDISHKSMKVQQDGENFRDLPVAPSVDKLSEKLVENIRTPQEASIHQTFDDFQIKHAGHKHGFEGEDKNAASGQPWTSQPPPSLATTSKPRPTQFHSSSSRSSIPSRAPQVVLTPQRSSVAPAAPNPSTFLWVEPPRVQQTDHRPPRPTASSRLAPTLVRRPVESSSLSNPAEGSRKANKPEHPLTIEAVRADLFEKMRLLMPQPLQQQFLKEIEDKLNQVASPRPSESPEKLSRPLEVATTTFPTTIKPLTNDQGTEKSRTSSFESKTTQRTPNNPPETTNPKIDDQFEIPLVTIPNLRRASTTSETTRTTSSTNPPTTPSQPAPTSTTLLEVPFERPIFPNQLNQAASTASDVRNSIPEPPISAQPLPDARFLNLPPHLSQIVQLVGFLPSGLPLFEVPKKRPVAKGVFQGLENQERAPLEILDASKQLNEGLVQLKESHKLQPAPPAPPKPINLPNFEENVNPLNANPENQQQGADKEKEVPNQTKDTPKSLISNESTRPGLVTPLQSLEMLNDMSKQGQGSSEKRVKSSENFWPPEQVQMVQKQIENHRQASRINQDHSQDGQNSQIQPQEAQNNQDQPQNKPKIQGNQSQPPQATEGSELLHQNPNQPSEIEQISILTSNLEVHSTSESPETTPQEVQEHKLHQGSFSTLLQASERLQARQQLDPIEIGFQNQENPVKSAVPDQKSFDSPALEALDKPSEKSVKHSEGNQTSDSLLDSEAPSKLIEKNVKIPDAAKNKQPLVDHTKITRKPPPQSKAGAELLNFYDELIHSQFRDMPVAHASKEVENIVPEKVPEKGTGEASQKSKETLQEKNQESNGQEKSQESLILSGSGMKEEAKRRSEANNEAKPSEKALNQHQIHEIVMGSVLGEPQKRVPEEVLAQEQRSIQESQIQESRIQENQPKNGLLSNEQLLQLSKHILDGLAKNKQASGLPEKSETAQNVQEGRLSMGLVTNDQEKLQETQKETQEPPRKLSNGPAQQDPEKLSHLVQEKQKIQVASAPEVQDRRNSDIWAENGQVLERIGRRKHQPDQKQGPEKERHEEPISGEPQESQSTQKVLNIMSEEHPLPVATFKSLPSNEHLPERSRNAQQVIEQQRSEPIQAPDALEQPRSEPIQVQRTSNSVERRVKYVTKPPMNTVPPGISPEDVNPTNPPQPPPPEGVKSFMHMNFVMPPAKSSIQWSEPTTALPLTSYGPLDFGQPRIIDPNTSPTPKNIDPTSPAPRIIDPNVLTLPSRSNNHIQPTPPQANPIQSNPPQIPAHIRQLTFGDTSLPETFKKYIALAQIQGAPIHPDLSPMLLDKLDELLNEKDKDRQIHMARAHAGVRDKRIHNDILNRNMPERFEDDKSEVTGPPGASSDASILIPIKELVPLMKKLVETAKSNTKEVDRNVSKEELREAFLNREKAMMKEKARSQGAPTRTMNSPRLEFGHIFGVKTMDPEEKAKMEQEAKKKAKMEGIMLNRMWRENEASLKKSAERKSVMWPRYEQKILRQLAAGGLIETEGAKTSKTDQNQPDLHVGRSPQAPIAVTQNPDALRSSENLRNQNIPQVIQAGRSPQASTRESEANRSPDPPKTSAPTILQASDTFRLSESSKNQGDRAPEVALPSEIPEEVKKRPKSYWKSSEIRRKSPSMPRANKYRTAELLRKLPEAYKNSLLEHYIKNAQQYARQVTGKASDQLRHRKKTRTTTTAKPKLASTEKSRLRNKLATEKPKTGRRNRPNVQTNDVRKESGLKPFPFADKKLNIQKVKANSASIRDEKRISSPRPLASQSLPRRPLPTAETLPLKSTNKNMAYHHRQQHNSLPNAETPPVHISHLLNGDVDTLMRHIMHASNLKTKKNA